jgi:hypothetical protein
VFQIEYKLYRRLPDGSIEQSPQLQAGKAKEKTVIRGLHHDQQQWRTRAAQAIDWAILMRSLPKDGGVFRGIADDGTVLQLYYRHPGIDSFFPVVP